MSEMEFEQSQQVVDEAQQHQLVVRHEDQQHTHEQQNEEEQHHHIEENHDDHSRVIIDPNVIQPHAIEMSTDDDDDDDDENNRNTNGNNNNTNGNGNNNNDENHDTQQIYREKSDDMDDMDDEDDEDDMSPQIHQHHTLLHIHQPQRMALQIHHEQQQHQQHQQHQQQQQQQQQQQDIHMHHHHHHHEENGVEIDPNSLVQLGPHEEIHHHHHTQQHHMHHHHHTPHHHPYTKKCCNCDCDCGQMMVNTMNDIISEKMGSLWDQYNKLFQQTQHIENLLNSVIHIKYPELKRKTMQQPPQPQQQTTTVIQQQQQVPSVISTVQQPPTTSVIQQQQPQIQQHVQREQIQNQPISPQNLMNMMDDMDDELPKKRRRNYSHDISNKINSILEPLFETGWVLLKDQERQLGDQIANEIGVEIAEGMSIVRSFWHRSRGNSKRLYTQLDDYRIGLELLDKEDPESKIDLIKKFKFEDMDQVRRDLEEVNKVLKEMAAKGSGRTSIKGKKLLKKLPDHSIKTFKGRSATLCNHFYHYTHNNLDRNTLELINPDFTPTQLANNLQQYQQQLQQQQLQQQQLQQQQLQ